MPGGSGECGLSESITRDFWCLRLITFKPDLVLVSAGFDAHWFESLQ